MVRISLFFLSALIFSQASAQFHVKEKDILYKRRLTRSVSMTHADNIRLFGENNQLVITLLEAFEKGELKGYQTEACEQEVSLEDFRKKLEWPEEDTVYNVDYTSLNVIEIGEDLIVDKHRSEIVFDMETVTVFLPEKHNYRGLLEPVVTFKYDDCSKIFKKDKRAFSKNPLGNGRNINYSEVLLLKLHTSEIVKIGDSNDPYFDQITDDPLKAFLLRKKSENELTEMLYKLFNPK